MSNVYQLRVTAEYVRDLEQLRAFLEEKYKVCVLFEEIGGETKKLHYQGWIETNFAQQTIRKHLVTHFSRGGNEAYSLSPKRTDDLFQYCAKDGKLWMSKGVDEKDIRTYIDEGMKRKSELSKKEVRQKDKNIISTIESEVPEEYGETPWDYCARVVDWYVERGKVLPQSLVLKQIIRTICARRLIKTDTSRYREFRRNIVNEAIGNFFSYD